MINLMRSARRLLWGDYKQNLPIANSAHARDGRLQTEVGNHRTETIGVIIGMMENKMETTIEGLDLKV